MYDIYKHKRLKNDKHLIFLANSRFNSAWNHPNKNELISVHKYPFMNMKIIFLGIYLT